MSIKITSSVGLLLLSIWLILTAAVALFGLSIPSQNVVMGLLAGIAGVLILIGK
jgi:hypothetical protein